MEWTTGLHSPGRRPHMHALVKGLPGEAAAALEPAISAKWERLTGGAWLVEARELRTPGGAIAYMVGHHHKREQAPPPSMRGVKRMRPSRGYFNTEMTRRIAEIEGRDESPTARLRRRAKEVMREATAQ